MKTNIDMPAVRQFTAYVCVVLAFAFGLWIIGQLQSVIELFLGSCFVALLLSPFIGRLRKWHFPDALAILTTFLSVFVAFILFVGSIVPIFVDLADDSRAYINRSVVYLKEQATNDFPALAELPFGVGKLIQKEIDLDMVSAFILDQDRGQIIANNLVGNIDSLQAFAQKGFSQISSLGLSFASGVTATIVNLSLFLLLTFFILLERQSLLRWFFNILPDGLEAYFKHRQHQISNAIHAWLRGQLTLAALMFLLNLVGLFIIQLFGVPVSNIFSLALIAGAMEFVPYAGPIIAFVPAFLMVLVSPDMTLWSLVGIMALYAVFQWIEGNVMVPMVMSHTLSLSPLYILVFTIIGASLGGIIGVLLAIPLASIVNIFYRDWMHYRATLE